jgi:hypothetical protein
MAKRIAVVALLLAWASGCEADDQAPRTFIAGPRVLAIKAQPPEVPPGASATVSVLVAGAQAEPVTVSWDRCLLAPLPGQASNPDCVTNVQASYLEPIGQGLTVTATMPADITADALGEPDASGGVYLTLVARVTVGAAEPFAAVYRLRLGAATGGNQNPMLTSFFVSDAAGSTPLDEANPLAVAPGDLLTLGVTFAAGSAETYTAPMVGSSGGSVKEVVRTAWFSTAGDFSNERTNDMQPTTVLSLEQRLPAPGAIIDIYAVARDERGGVDYAHRTLRLD